MISHEEVLENLQKASLYYQEILQYILKKKAFQHHFKHASGKFNHETATKMLHQVMEHPEKFTEINLEYLSDFQKLVSDSVSKFMGNEVEDDDEETDKRFKDPAWEDNIYFDFVKQYYLITSDWMKKSVKQYHLDEDGKKYIEFATQQFIDALSPANFPFSNPEVMRESLDSGMENIVKGMENFLKDIKKPGSMLNITTTDKASFKVGKNIAATPGKVIYENELMQLICYEPKDKVRAIPLLIVPPWINKYYILDLSENNSMVKWLVDNNYQVFLISWVNPRKSLGNKKFEAYMQEGVFEAYEQIAKLGYKKINAMGYCIGGTLLACALSYLKSKKKKYINSATYLTTLLDFSKPGDIGVLINEDSLEHLEEELREVGYLNGNYLSNSFSLIRANDLVWSYFVNNYLLGKRPAAFDILYWNSDSTNLPAEMYIYYLRKMYIENKLVKPGGLEMLGEKIDISKIDVPSFSLAAKSDHIALWKGVFNGYKLLGGDKTFCLTDAGHVAGVVNPADNKKYSHFYGKNVEGRATSWIKQATNKKGSWWNTWENWLEDYSGKMTKPLNYKKLKFIEEAPGRYVKKKI